MQRTSNGLSPARRCQLPKATGNKNSYRAVLGIGPLDFRVWDLGRKGCDVTLEILFLLDFMLYRGVHSPRQPFLGMCYSIFLLLAPDMRVLTILIFQVSQDAQTGAQLPKFHYVFLSVIPYREWGWGLEKLWKATRNKRAAELLMPVL